MAREYAPEVKSSREYATEAPQTFTPDADTTYSPEGIPLVTPSTQAAPSGAAGTAANIMTDVVSAPIRGAMGAIKPVVDIAKWAGYKEPVKALEQIDTGIKQQTGPISTAGSFAGDIAGLTGLGGVVTKGAKAVPQLKAAAEWAASTPLRQSVLGGAGIGALQAEPNASDALTGAVTGAAAGAVGTGLFKGLGAALSPALQRLKELEAQGFSREQIIKDTTIGQLLGGGIQKVENFLNAIPFGGVAPKINQGVKSLTAMADAEKAALTAQEKTGVDALNLAKDAEKLRKEKELEALHSDLKGRLEGFIDRRNANLKAEEGNFHVPMINQALQHINVKLDPNVTGTDAIRFGQDAISKAYDDALAKIGDVRIGDDIVNSLKSLAEIKKKELGPDFGNRFESDVNSLINKAGDTKLLSSKQWQNSLSDLGDKSYDYITTGTASEKEYGRALKELKDHWMDAIEGQAGSAELKAANDAHAKFQAPQRAASYLSSIKKEGEFSPENLLNAIKAGTSTRRFAGGRDDLQQQATQAYKDMIAKRDQYKKAHDSLKEQHEARVAKDKELLDQSHDIAARNIKLRQDALKAKTDVHKNQLSSMVKDVESHPVGNYAENRTLYNLAGMGALAGGGYGLGQLTGMSKEDQALLAGSLVGGTRLGYSRPIQTLLKKVATAQRPELVQQAGQALKQVAPMGGLAAAENYTAPPPKEGGLP
jgi:hypothetical protein